MLRACAFYLPVTIPDQISIYGMPRLIRWVCQIDPPGDRPKLLGYVLNALNRSGGGMVGSSSAHMPISLEVFGGHFSRTSKPCSEMMLWWGFCLDSM
jgi:hypothetical protein